MRRVEARGTWTVARVRPLIAIAVVASMLTVGGHGPADASGVAGRRARPADALVDSIGLNVHLHYTDTVYNRFHDLVRPRLRELGVRHIRDGVYTYAGASADTFYYRRLRELRQDGIDANLITSIDTRFGERTDVARLDDVQVWAGGAVESFEGVNEPDLNGGDDWAVRTRDLQRDIWEKVRSDPALQGVDVIGPSPSFDPTALGDISHWTTFGNWHAYPGGNCAGCADVYGGSFDTRVDRYRGPTGDDPLIVTETGYHNAIVGEQEHRPVSERAAGIYVPRLLFEYFNRGVERTYLHELIDRRDDVAHRDRDAHFGLLRNDGSRKPAFVATRNLIDLLEDPGPSFTPGTLAFTLTGETDEIHTTLLQKRDGTFHLALWQERTSYDTGQRANRPDVLSARGGITVPDQQVTVTTDPVMSDATLYRPGEGTRPMRTWSATRAFTFDVPDEVVLLEMRSATDEADEPADEPTASPTLPPPATPRPIDVSGVCDAVPRGVFTDVPVSHPFAAEIDCLAAWDLTRGTRTGRYAPGGFVPRWQMAVFIDRLTAIGGQRGAAVDHRYRDVTSLSAEARGAIARLSHLGIVKGTTSSAFAPFERVTRAQTAAFVSRVRNRNGAEPPPPKNHFTDDDGNVHERDIDAIAGAGIIQGVGGRSYRPGKPVTRGQMAAILTRHIQVEVNAGRLDGPP